MARSNSQTELSDRLYIGDITGDGDDEFLVVEGRRMSAFSSAFEHRKILDHYFPADIKRLIVGDFVPKGRRERGTQQICALLDNGRSEWIAISDDRTEMWWGSTQGSFVADHEHYIVGDFDEDGEDEILVFNPRNGQTRLYQWEDQFFKEDDSYRPGNLDGLDLRGKILLAGEFNGKQPGTDLVVVDPNERRISRYRGLSDNGTPTFWWAFTSSAGVYERGGVVRVVNIEGGKLDGLMVWQPSSGDYQFLAAEYGRGKLRTIDDVDQGQLPRIDRNASFKAVKVRDHAFRDAPDGPLRDDIISYDRVRDLVIQTDARVDSDGGRTYWWAYTSDRLFEPVQALRRPWAVILARFSDTPGDPEIEKYIRDVFRPGAGGLAEYWQDASLGRIDISSSRVFGWVTLDITRAEAGNKNYKRGALIDKAIQAAQRQGLNVTNGFHSQVAVFTHDWATDDVPYKQVDWNDDKWKGFWIDGSADGKGRVSAPPHGQSGSFLAHEIGHGLGLRHDRYPDLKRDYGDPYSIMSAMRVKTYRHPEWNVAFGPTLSLPQLVANNWMIEGRLNRVPLSWRNLGTTEFELAPLDDRTAEAHLGAVLPSNIAPPSGLGRFLNWPYYLEYMRPRGWNQGIDADTVVIRRMVPGASRTPSYLTHVEVPADGSSAEVKEESGKVTFSVRRAEHDGRTVRVTVRES